MTFFKSSWFILCLLRNCLLYPKILQRDWSFMNVTFLTADADLGQGWGAHRRRSSEKRGCIRWKHGGIPLLHSWRPRINFTIFLVLYPLRPMGICLGWWVKDYRLIEIPCPLFPSVLWGNGRRCDPFVTELILHVRLTIVIEPNTFFGSR